MSRPVPPRLLLLAVVGGALLLAGLAVASWLDRRSRDRASQAKGAERVVIQERHTADTLYRTQRDALVRRLTRVDTLTRTLRITDTVAVKEYVAACDSLARSCRETVATAERRVLLADSLTALVRVQLAAAQRRPRFTREVGAAYDFTARAVQADAGVGLRLVGGLSATASVQHTFTPNESPRLLVGGRWTF